MNNKYTNTNSDDDKLINHTNDTRQRSKPINIGSTRIVGEVKNIIDEGETIPCAEPVVYSTKLSADDKYGDDFLFHINGRNNDDHEIYPQSRLLSVTRDMNQLFSLRFSLKCFMLCQIISSCLYATFNPFFFLFLCMNYYVYKSISSYNKKGVWYYMVYLIVLNFCRLFFFVWTLIAVNDFDTNRPYDTTSGSNGNISRESNQIVYVNNNTSHNIIYTFHYGPIGYTILFFFINTFIDVWFIKLLHRYHTLINKTSVFEINHLIKHGGGEKYIMLW